MIGLIAIGLCVLLQFGVEASIDITIEDVNIRYADPKYFDPEKTEIFVEENDAQENALNSPITMVKKLPDDVKGRLTMLGLSMGVYKIPTGIDTRLQLCDMLDEPVVLGPLLNAFGFSKTSCPPPPGTYVQEGYVLPLDLMPDSFVENKYQTTFDIFVGKKVIFTTTAILDIRL